MTLYVLCGLPASGKTTLSEKLAAQHNAKIFHCDEYKPHQKRKLYKEIKEALNSSNVILDGIFLKSITRKNLLDALKEVECKKILIRLDASIEECIERNKERKRPLSDNVLYHFNKKTQEPMLEEGWSEIQHI